MNLREVVDILKEKGLDESTLNFLVEADLLDERRCKIALVRRKYIEKLRNGERNMQAMSNVAEECNVSERYVLYCIYKFSVDF